MRDISHIPTPVDPIPLGAFELIAPLAEGGMAQVWRGAHRESGAAVAIKILEIGEQGETYRRRLRHEVRSIARLEHPNIVDVYDYGEVDEQSARAADGRFRPGQPYVVMEFAADGTLRETDLEFDWPSYAEMLMTLLEALGHAHARGIVHRDLKPSNVVDVGYRDRRRLALTDFGLAYLADTPDPEVCSDHRTRGTPAYMAPEQFRERATAYGPWTDLYGLGCLAWEVATGRPPFYAPNSLGVAWKHLEEPLPEFTPVFEVPSGFRDWLDGLLAKSPAERFDDASRAARALERICQATGPSRPSSRRRLFGRPGLYSRLSDEEPCRPAPDCLEDLPWQPQPYLAGTSLGLYSIRRPALVDRDDERELLWERLRRVARRGSPELALLRGPSGTGKTRLADWLRERAAELGCATGLKVLHSPSQTRRDGLAAMIARHLRVDEAGDASPAEIVEQWFERRGVHDPYACRSITSLLAEAGLGTDGKQLDVQLERFEQRAGALERFLRAAGSTGPLVVHLDDVVWGDASVRFVDYALRQIEDLSVLFVATLRDETLAEVDSERRARLEELTRRRETTEIEIGPWGPRTSGG